MIKSELIDKITQKSRSLSDADVAATVNGLLEQMIHALSQGKRVEIRGFGSFNLHYRPPRNAHNPKTGQKVFTAPKYIPHFKPGKEFRERVNNAYLREQDQHSSSNHDDNNPPW